MKISSAFQTVYLSDEDTGKSAVLRHDGTVWRLSLEGENHVYDDLETAVSVAASILADEREGNEKTD